MQILWLLMMIVHGGLWLDCRRASSLDRYSREHTMKFRAVAIGAQVLILIAAASAAGHEEQGDAVGFSAELVRRSYYSAPVNTAAAVDQKEEPIAVYQFLSQAYLMKVYVGPELEERHLYPDTGSGLIWLQCDPCSDCNGSVDPPYNAMASSTYKRHSCRHPMCLVGDRRYPGMVYCGPNNLCRFGIGYLDTGRTSGPLSSDVFHFYTSSSLLGRPRREKYELTFGCAENDRSVHTRRPITSGIFGLDQSPLSFVSQLSISRFSYCLPPVPEEDHSNMHSSHRDVGVGYILFGADAEMLGERIPILPDKEEYVVALLGISVNYEPLDIRIPSEMGYYELAVDSGAGGPWLPGEAYNSLVAAVEGKLKTKRRQYPGLPETCYLCRFGDVDGIEVTLHLTGNANVVLRGTAIFRNAGDYVCS